MACLNYVIKRGQKGLLAWGLKPNSRPPNFRLWASLWDRMSIESRKDESLFKSNMNKKPTKLENTYFFVSVHISVHAVINNRPHYEQYSVLR